MRKNTLYLAFFLCCMGLNVKLLSSNSSLEGEKYTNIQGQEITYNHKDRIEEIMSRSNEIAKDGKGKKLHMVIGRGTKELKEKNEEKTRDRYSMFYDFSEPLGDEDNIWVYSNNWPVTQELGKYLHLMFDFNIKEDLDSIPDKIFTSIVFDASVTKYIRNPEKTYINLGKKIIKYGYLYILPDTRVPVEEQKSRVCSTEEYLQYYKEKLKPTFRCEINEGNYPIFIPLAPDQKLLRYLKCQRVN